MLSYSLVENHNTPSAAWELIGISDDHIQIMINCLTETDAVYLTTVPQIQLHGSNVCDTGGVFRAKINETFDYLLQRSDLFTFNELTRRYGFTPYSHVSLQQKRKRYQVFEKILYWFVIIHEQIPYPMDLDSSILAFCIYGYIPLDLSEMENPSFVKVAQQIRQLDINSTTILVPLSKDITDWLYQFEITRKEFTQKLRDSEQGPEVVACQLGTTAILGHYTEQFKWVAEGFKHNIPSLQSVSSNTVYDC